MLFTVLSFVIGLNNAALTILSQQKGRGGGEGLRRYLNSFVVLLAGLSIGLGIIGFILAEPLLRLVGTPEGILPMAAAYLKINFIGTALRSVGDSKSPLYFVAIAVVLNTVLDPLFISVFNWGVEGAAYATIISQGTAFFIGFFYILSKRILPFTRPSVPAKREVLDILRLGIPEGLQMGVISEGVLAIMSVVASFGPALVAGCDAAQRLDSLIMLPAQALGTALNLMAG